MTSTSTILYRGRNTELRDCLNRLQSEGKITGWKFDTGPQDQLHYVVWTRDEYVSAPLGTVNEWLERKGWK